MNLQKSQGKHSVVIEKTQNKFVKRGSSFRPNKSKLSTNVQVNPNDFEKENLQNKELQKDLRMMQSTKIKSLNQVQKREK